MLGGRANIDLSNLPVVQATFDVVDPCAEPVETFATDQQILHVDLGPNGVAEVRFGPANAGPGIVVVDMYQTPFAPPTPAPARPPVAGVQVVARRAVGAGAIGAGGLTGTGVGVVARDNNTGPGGGGVPPPPPGTGPLPQGAFRIEVRPPAANAAAARGGPGTADVHAARAAAFAAAADNGAAERAGAELGRAHHQHDQRQRDGPGACHLRRQPADPAQDLRPRCA